MGVAVSNWRLARAVSLAGELGVISGTLLALVLARRLQAGDPDGDMRRALAHFPIPGVAAQVIEEHFIPGGKDPAAPYRAVPMPTFEGSARLERLTMAANFVEVFLAKEGHEGRVGINLLEKIQLPTLPSLYGAMLAGVDYVLMGAGIPRSIPGALDRLAVGEPAELKVDVEGARPEEVYRSRLVPAEVFGAAPPQLRRPHFLAIVSSSTLALTLARKANGRVDGFVIEGDVAGGHNAPPRGPLKLDAAGEPIYGERDRPDLAAFRELGLPFWLAGAFDRPEKFAEARAQGAAGIQVGTAFALCAESGIEPALRERALAAMQNGTARVFTDPLASPTGFPFKVLQLPGTLSASDEYLARERVCDLGYLRQPYRKESGELGYRCAAEPVEDFVRKGGDPADLVGRKCLCNGLAATVGLAQVRAGVAELPLVTAGNTIAEMASRIQAGPGPFRAADVIRYLRGETAQPVAAG